MRSNSIILGGFFFCATLASVPAADRVALVIGNNAYQQGAPLRNPINDAKAVAGALKGAGFEVLTAEDAGLEAMEKKVVEFSRAAKGAKAAWFYYSGHGAEVKGTNYLIPVDAAVQEEFQVKHKTLALDQVLSAMDDAGAPLKVVVLDCCRDNPFGKSWSRSGSKGLAQIGETPSGTIIAFATAPGKTAADGSGQNSPYTTALVQALNTPGLEVDQVFKIAGRNVLLATSQQQQPWVNSSFFDTFVVKSGTPPGNQQERPSTPQSQVAGESDRVSASKENPFVNSLGMKFVPVPGTNVLFCIHETRKADYAKYAVANSGVDGKWKSVQFQDVPISFGDDHPVVCVTWNDAVAFCTWLSRTERMEYRLPSDQEWSVAVGIGGREDPNATPQSKDQKIEDVYPWGETYPPREAVGNYADSAFLRKFEGWTVLKGYTDGYATTAPVMKFKPNKLGLYDLGGNVSEWCQDWYTPTPELKIIPKMRVERGGHWLTSGGGIESSARHREEPVVLSDTVGFRVVLVVSQN